MVRLCPRDLTKLETRQPHTVHKTGQCVPTAMSYCQVTPNWSTSQGLSVDGLGQLDGGPAQRSWPQGQVEQVSPSAGEARAPAVRSIASVLGPPARSPT